MSTLKPLELELWTVLNHMWLLEIEAKSSPLQKHQVLLTNHVSISETVNDVKSNKDIEGMKLIANWMKQKTIH